MLLLRRNIPNSVKHGVQLARPDQKPGITYRSRAQGKNASPFGAGPQRCSYHIDLNDSYVWIGRDKILGLMAYYQHRVYIKLKTEIKKYCAGRNNIILIIAMLH